MQSSVPDLLKASSVKPAINSPVTHLNSLDGLRAIAALLVLFTHGLSAHLWTGYNVSSIGVAVFFSLSGFLMGYLYLEKKPDAQVIKNYLISRFSRIAPAYLFTIIVAFVIYSYLDHEFIYKIDLHNLVRHLLFSGNVAVFWSIPPEVQFYVFFIFIWLAFFQYRQGSFNMIMLVAAVILLMLMVRNHVPGTTLPSKIHFFALGCAAGVLRRKMAINATVLLNVLQAAAFLGLIIYGTYLVSVHDYRYPYAIFHYALLTAMTVFILSYQTGFTQCVLANKLLMAIGQWSFSLYLSHEAVMYFMTHYVHGLPRLLMAAGTVILAIILSWLMYSLIEVPTQAALKRRLTRK